MKIEFSNEYMCYRYGGEEFVILLQDTSLDIATDKAESFRMKFANTMFRVEDHTYQKTISIGLASLMEGDDVKSLLSKADRAMYKAKSTGKNKICSG